MTEDRGRTACRSNLNLMAENQDLKMRAPANPPVCG
jgi:hypothetical protein